MLIKAHSLFFCWQRSKYPAMQLQETEHTRPYLKLFVYLITEIDAWLLGIVSVDDTDAEAVATHNWQLATCNMLRLAGSNWDSSEHKFKCAARRVEGLALMTMFLREGVSVCVCVYTYGSLWVIHIAYISQHSQNYSHSERGNKLRFMCERLVQKVAQLSANCTRMYICVSVCIAWWPLWYGNMVNGKWFLFGVG